MGYVETLGRSCNFLRLDRENLNVLKLYLWKPSAFPDSYFSPVKLPNVSTKYGIIVADFRVSASGLGFQGWDFRVRVSGPGFLFL